MQDKTGDDLLEIYLNDHWAGAGGGAALARSLQRHNSDTDCAEMLAQITAEIQSDDEDLEVARSRLGVSGGSVKRVLARVAERVRTAKPNGSFGGYSALSRVLEAESLIAGVAGKQRLWIALQCARGDDPRLAGFDLERLIERADSQIARLKDFHKAAAVLAFPQG